MPGSLNNVCIVNIKLVDPGGRVAAGIAGYDSRWEHGCISRVYMLCFPVSVEAFATA
jgi:hypothetical protein